MWSHCSIAVVLTFPGSTDFLREKTSISGLWMTWRHWWRYVFWFLTIFYHIYKLPQVYLPTIAGHVPDDMVNCVVAFLGICYIIQLNAIDSCVIENQLTNALDQYDQYCQYFLTTSVCKRFNLPCNHAWKHIIQAIQLFSSPNGLCSLITELKHIVAVKQPWPW